MVSKEMMILGISTAIAAMLQLPFGGHVTFDDVHAAHVARSWVMFILC